MKSAKNSEIVYRGLVVNIHRSNQKLPNGKTCEYEVVMHPGGSATLAIDSENRVCLLRQYRPAVDCWQWELPAGRIDPGETPAETARRELQEEAGLNAEEWHSLGSLYSSPGVYNEIIHLFLARNLAPIPSDHEEYEIIEIHWFPYHEAVDMAYRGVINDAKTMIGLFRAKPQIEIRDG